MAIGKIIKTVLCQGSLAEQELKITRNILNCNLLPNFSRRFIYRIHNYLPRKKIVTRIKLGTKLEALYELDLNSYGPREIFYGNFEKATIAFYKKILQTKRCVWDIGSNIGFYAVIAGILLKGRGEVFVFEPVPINFSALQTNVGLNSLTNVYLLNVALSSDDGESEIYLLDTDIVTSSPTLNREWALQSDLHKHITIKTKSAMSLLSRNEIRKPDMIKIDAETHEPIILGTLEPILIANDAPDIICEVMPPTIEPLYELLVDKYHYKPYHISPKGINVVQELKMQRPYNDYFFTKRSTV